MTELLPSTEPVQEPDVREPNVQEPAVPRSRRTMMLRAAAFVVFVLAGFLAFRFTPLAEYLDEDKLLATFEALRHTWWAPLLLIGLYAVVSPMGVPVSPLMLGGGAVFGFLLGSLYNTIGLALGAALSYFLARQLGRDFVVHLTGGKLRRAEAIFAAHGFWPLVQTRFMPLPFAVVNFGAALAGIGAGRFLATTILGLIPATVMHTYFISALFETREGRGLVLLQYVVVILVFNLVIGFPSIRAWLRHRYERRAAARSGEPERE